MIITNSDLQVFKKDIKNIIIQQNRWFNCNLLSLNVDKTYLLQFLIKHSRDSDLQISYENKQISKMYNIKFLGLIDNNLCWGFSMEEIVPKLNKALLRNQISQTVYVFRSIRW
jgi:hypothetical protein